ncbi:MAG: DUF4159 domain-containing protein, partial [Anaerolineae bacterium]|nr:DUF4159 domain-containing protein [Anaerolineae bacterium]
MVLGEIEAATLREYLTRGGFWMIDDFWGSFEWSNFEGEMKKILPEGKIVDIPKDHPKVPVIPREFFYPFFMSGSLSIFGQANVVTILALLLWIGGSV